jgi:hypothetical protein
MRRASGTASAHRRPRRAEIVAKLNSEINAGLADRRLKTRLADLGGAVLALSRNRPLRRRGLRPCCANSNSGSGGDCVRSPGGNASASRRARGRAQRRRGIPGRMTMAAEGRHSCISRLSGRCILARRALPRTRRSCPVAGIGGGDCLVPHYAGVFCPLRTPPHR